MTTNVRSAGIAGGAGNIGNDKRDESVAATGGKGQQKRFNKMSGGQSINHLLNFSLPPRQSNNLQSLPRRSRKTVTGYSVWNKEKFVNAQYRFVMKPYGDYTVHFADPDIFFQWQDILQVIIPRISAFASASGRQEDPSVLDEGHITCPICLSAPSAPRMTKCGHVFCYPCVLHYLSTSDHAKWNRCPICFDSINEKQLKSVKWYDEPSVQDDASETSPETSSSSQVEISGDSFRPGSILRMRLMERPQITMLALPRSRTWPSEVIPPHQAPFHFLPDVYRFSRFMLATPDYLLLNLLRDVDELAAERRILASMKDDLSVSFVDLAEEKVRQQMSKAAALETPELKEAITRAELSIRDIERDHEERGRRRAERDHNSDPHDVGEVPEALLAAQDAPVPSNMPKTKPVSTHRGQRSRRNLNPPPPSTQSYYFYQAASGMSIFLHPLDIRIMLSHFQSYAAFPDTITVRVDASSEGSVDAELRRRCKYLAHMPESADVVFVEADLTSVVGETIRAFEAPLRARRAKRRERDKKEDRARQRAMEKEFEKFRVPAAQPPLSPVFNLDDVVVTSPERPPSESVAVETSPVSQTPNTPIQAGAWGQRSFASAAQSGRSRIAQQQITPVAHREPLDEDEWDLDVEWHEMRRSGGGRRKRANKMVVLGGNGGRRR